MIVNFKGILVWYFYSAIPLTVEYLACGEFIGHSTIICLHTCTLTPPLYRCAGLIAAVANNSVCGVGVAHKAQVSGIRMLDGTVTDILEGQSFIYKAHVNSIYSCSWGPEDSGRSIEGPGYIAKVGVRGSTSWYVWLLPSWGVTKTQLF